MKMYVFVVDDAKLRDMSSVCNQILFKYRLFKVYY